MGAERSKVCVGASVHQEHNRHMHDEQTRCAFAGSQYDGRHAAYRVSLKKPVEVQGTCPSAAVWMSQNATPLRMKRARSFIFSACAVHTACAALAR